MVKVGDIFKPGQECKQSGIYTVVHDTVHAQRHDVTVVYGEPFPPCVHCGQHPRFALKHAAQHVRSHDSFRKKSA
jgi:hypothetical protein